VSSAPGVAGEGKRRRRYGCCASIQISQGEKTLWTECLTQGIERWCRRRQGSRRWPVTSSTLKEKQARPRAWSYDGGVEKKKELRRLIRVFSFLFQIIPLLLAAPPFLSFAPLHYHVHPYFYLIHLHMPCHVSLSFTSCTPCH